MRGLFTKKDQHNSNKIIENQEILLRRQERALEEKEMRLKAMMEGRGIVQQKPSEVKKEELVDVRSSGSFRLKNMIKPEHMRFFAQKPESQPVTPAVPAVQSVPTQQSVPRAPQGLQATQPTSNTNVFLPAVGPERNVLLIHNPNQKTTDK